MPPAATTADERTTHRDDAKGRVHLPGTTFVGNPHREPPQVRQVLERKPNDHLLWLLFFFSIPVHISAWPPPLLRIFPPARLPGSDLVLGVGGAGEGMMAACSHGRLMGRRRRRGWCLAGIELVAAARATTVRTATVTVTTACITFSPLTTTPRRRRSPRRASQTTGTAATAAAAAAATTTPARSPTVAMVASEVATATAAAVTATATTTAMVGCASVDEGRRPPPQGRRCYDTGEGECHDGGGHDGFRVGGEGKVAVVGSASWAG